MRRYLNVSKRAVLDLEPGAEGELELSPQAELDLINRGYLEPLPVEYEVTSHHKVFGNDPGSKFEMSLTAGQELLLIEGGHLARVEIKPPARKRRADKE